MRAANEQTTYDTIVAQERAAMERWYTGDPSGYVELFVDDLTYFAPVSGGRLESVSALKELFASIEGMIKVPRFIVAPIATGSMTGQDPKDSGPTSS